MNIIVRVIAISIFFMAASTTVLKAQSEETDFIFDSIEEITVCGNRVPIALNKSARMVTILDSASIASSPAETVNDLLKYAVGVDVRQRGGMGIQTDIGIRGGSADQIAILLNGINICDPQTGHFGLDIPVDMNEIERIEILEGPAGRVYGTSSLVGAINIVTKNADSSSADIHLEGGSYGYLTGGARGNIKSGRFNNQISASYGRSDGYSRNTGGALNSDFNTAKAFYQGKFSDNEIDVNWYAGLSEKGFGANTFYSARYDDQYEHTSKAYFAVQAETKGFFHFKPSIYWNYSTDRFELFRGDESIVPFNYHKTNVYGLNLNCYVETFLGKTAFGAEMRNEGIISTALGDSLNEAKKISGSDRYYQLGLNRTNINFYLEHNIILKKFTLSAGLTAAKNSWNEMDFRFYPGVDASYRIGSAWKLYGSYNTSLRMPTFTELYYSVGGHKADKYLKPEEMTAYEFGIKFLRGGVRLQADIYYHRGKNMIDWIRDISEGEDALWRSVNHTSVNTVGEELSIDLDMDRLLHRQSVISNIFIGFSHIDQSIETVENIQSKYALEYLRNKFVATMDFKPMRNIILNLSYRWQQRVGNYEVYEQEASTGKLKSYSPYSLVDAKVVWSPGQFKFYLSAENLLDHPYFDHGNIPQPGLWLKLGMTYSIIP